MDAISLTKIVAALVLPPGALILLLLAALALTRRAPRAAAVVVVVTIVSLYLLSAPVFSDRLLAAVEHLPALALDDPRLGQQQAIVVLGGGRRPQAAEYGGATVAARTLERLRYGARLHKASGLPVAVTGGAAPGTGDAEGLLMARALEQDFGVRVRWIEDRSRNTEQNAAFTAELLARDQVSRVALVSHASHLPRAVEMFRRQGLEVLPAPTAFLAARASGGRALDWLPSTGALGASGLALHELAGRLWYRLRQS